MALFSRDQGLLQRDLSLVNFGFRRHFSIKIQLCIFWDSMYVWKKIISKFCWHCIISVWSLVRLQNVICADHKKLIKGKKRVLMMNFKHASILRHSWTPFAKLAVINMKKKILSLVKVIFANVCTIIRKVIITILFDWVLCLVALDCPYSCHVQNSVL